MVERKGISKKIRYEVLKRDSFTCQYCGKMAPEVILEVDHIIPVAEGGDNEIFNLITSCRDCNRGKGKVKLDDNTTINKQKQMLKDSNEMREQIEMMVKWRRELRKIDDLQVEEICNLISSITSTGVGVSDHGKSEIKKMIKKFGFEEVYISTEIAFDKYYWDQEKGAEFAFNKIGGVCYNRKYQIKGK